MLADVWTIVWKEWKELLAASSGFRGGRLGVLIFVGVFGVFLPLQSGRAWVDSPIGLLYWAWVPLFLVNSVIADSFAGERERRTLETLLASRLSDRAILLGKMAAAVSYGWGLSLVGIVLGLITVNVTSADGTLLLYPPGIGLGIALLSLLTSCLVAGAGVLISLRAATVRQAAQTVSIAVMLLLFVPIFGLQALPLELRINLAKIAMGIETTQAVLAASGILAVLDVALFLAASSRFQRAKLILS